MMNRFCHLNFIVFVCIINVQEQTTLDVKLDVIDETFVQYINTNSSIRWKAVPINEIVHFEYSEHLFRVSNYNLQNNYNFSVIKTYKHLNIELPVSFDSRLRWPKCTTIGHVYDQSGCGSCWAVSSAAVMSDRICITYNQKLSVQISALDLISCCTECGDGCHGGYINIAFTHWIKYGLCTGGDYHDLSTCLPYPYAICNKEYRRKHIHCDTPSHNPTCVKKCQSEYKLSYSQDLYYGKDVYQIQSNTEDIMKEIYVNGSVVASMVVYVDFRLYKTGVYHRITTNTTYGYHAIKMIGWGIENTIPYWLCVNSWNIEWGDNGLFKILRGSDECTIEDLIITGTPGIL